MTKFLLILFVIITGLKLISDNRTLAYRCCIIEQASPDNGNNGEEGGHEKDTFDNEDELPFKFPAYHAGTNETGAFQFPLKHHRPDSGLADKPYTPPELI